ncbi:hypothetical protein ACMZ4W_01395 [Brevundimonas naejangsanensis]
MSKDAKRKVRQRQILHWAQGGRCAGCGQQMTLKRGLPRDRSDYPTYDHIVQKSRGGGHGLINGLLKHFACNMRRGSITRTSPQVLVGWIVRGPPNGRASLPNLSTPVSSSHVRTRRTCWKVIGSPEVQVAPSRWRIRAICSSPRVDDIKQILLAALRHRRETEVVKNKKTPAGKAATRAAATLQVLLAFPIISICSKSSITLMCRR